MSRNRTQELWSWKIINSAKMLHTIPHVEPQSRSFFFSQRETEQDTYITDMHENKKIFQKTRLIKDSKASRA